MSTVFDDLETTRGLGAPVIACFPLYPPLELLHSLGVYPVVLWGLGETVSSFSRSDRHIQPYACSVARRLAEFLLSDAGTLVDGVCMYNACDTLRNLPEILDCGLRESARPLPFFRLHVPAVSGRLPGSFEYFIQRLGEFIGGLESAFGVRFSPERFLESCGLYAEARRLAAAAESLVADGALSYNEFSAAIARGCFLPVETHIAVLRGLIDSARKDARNSGGMGIVLSGILPPPAPLVKAIESAGLKVVANDIATQGRSYLRRPPPSPDPAEYYADYYFRQFPCTTLLPTADGRPGMLEELVERSGARGVLFVGEKFCEYEYFEFPYCIARLRDRRVHVLEVELSAEDRDAAALVTRIDAFAELIAAGTEREER